MEALKQKVLWQAIDVLERQEFDFTARLRLPYYLFIVDKALQGLSYYLTNTAFSIALLEGKRNTSAQRKGTVCVHVA